MLAGVNGCLCGLRVGDLPSCKKWMFQTGNPSLAGMLSHWHCDKDHECAPSLGGDVLAATGRYPRTLGRLVVLSLMLKWYPGREWTL